MGKNFIKKFNGVKNKKKGGITIFEILLYTALLLLVAYPLYKSTANSAWTTITTWVTTSINTIFKAVSAISTII